MLPENQRGLHVLRSGGLDKTSGWTRVAAQPLGLAGYRTRITPQELVAVENCWRRHSRAWRC